MQAIWTKGLKTKAEKEAKASELKSYARAFEALREKLKELKKPTANRNYTEAGWHYKQIAHNEYNAAIDDLIKLMEV